MKKVLEAQNAKRKEAVNHLLGFNSLELQIYKQLVIKHGLDIDLKELKILAKEAAEEFYKE
jgi:hypothetical protein